MFSALNSVCPDDHQGRYLVVDESDEGTVVFCLPDLAAGRQEKVGQVRGAIARNEYDPDELIDLAIESLADDVFEN
jgi:hypothetical protein